jgi:hypothetical protein
LSQLLDESLQQFVATTFASSETSANITTESSADNSLLRLLHRLLDSLLRQEAGKDEGEDRVGRGDSKQRQQQFLLSVHLRQSLPGPLLAAVEHQLRHMVKNGPFFFEKKII